METESVKEEDNPGENGNRISQRTIQKNCFQTEKNNKYPSQKGKKKKTYTLQTRFSFYIFFYIYTQTDIQISNTKKIK